MPVEEARKATPDHAVSGATPASAACRLIEVGGVGYDPHGGFTLDERESPADEIPVLLELARAAALCNDATLHRTDGGWTVEGDPMEGALLVLARKAGIDPADEGQRLPLAAVGAAVTVAAVTWEWRQRTGP